MSQEMTLDAILHQADRFQSPAVSMTEEVRKVVQRAKAETADEASAYFLHAMLLAIENLAQGNKLVAGRAFDDALTHFLADLKAELGHGFASNAAALLIRNIALFLDGRKRDMVLAALDVEGKSQ
jgi:hypothetical protein